MPCSNLACLARSGTCTRPADSAFFVLQQRRTTRQGIVDLSDTSYLHVLYMADRWREEKKHAASLAPSSSYQDTFRQTSACCRETARRMQQPSIQAACWRMSVSLIDAFQAGIGRQDHVLCVDI
jgi:hypothetical protein